MKTKKRQLIILFFMVAFCLGWNNVAWADDYDNFTAGGWTEWNGIYNNGEYRLIGGKTYYVKERITVGADGLKLKVVGSGDVIIRRHSGFTDAGSMFYAKDGSLYIHGNNNSYVIIDGGAKYNEEYDARSGLTNSPINTMLIVTNYAINIAKVIFQNAKSANGSAVYCLNRSSDSFRHHSFVDVIIRGCYATAKGAAIYFEKQGSGDNPPLTTDQMMGRIGGNFEVYGCYSGTWGTICNEDGAWNTYLELGYNNGYNTRKTNISIHDNEANLGGAIFWCGDGKQHGETTASSNYIEVVSNMVNEIKIYNNVARNYGGGICIYAKATFKVTGTAYNPVIDIYGNTAANYGGGFCLWANETKMSLGSCTLKVRDNIANGKPDNFYIQSGRTISLISGAIFKPVDVGVTTEEAAPKNIILGATAGQITTICNNLQSGTYHVYDDRQLYSAEQNPSTTTYLRLYSSSLWTPLQQQARASDLVMDEDDYYMISNVKQLTAFLWKVNGIYTYETSFSSPAPAIKGRLMADIDMEGHYWVPIANYEGTFDGNGYTISHLTMAPTNGSTGGRGMFGENTSGTITNVILNDCYFGSTTASINLGAIVSENGGTVSNSMAEGTLYTDQSDCIMGGIAGSNSGTIHSSFAAPEMTGYQMGGLVGDNTGSLANSFANASFSETGTTNYFGGLVGVNTGRVENCYVRVHGTAPSSTYFGYLAGDNTSTENKGLFYCYSPNSTYVSSSGTAGNMTGHGTYGETVTPYLYKHRDNQITLALGASSTYVNTEDASADNQLRNVLNEWVGTSATYAKWLRPTTKYINDDLPLLRLPANNAVAATNGEAELDYNQVNDLLSSYTTASDAICLYGRESSMNGNASSSAKLYIDQEAVLKQSGTGGALNAYVGVALENRKVDNYQWHMFSTALQNVPLGVNYNGNTTSYGFSWGHPEDMPYWRFYDDASNHGYFPSMDYTWAAANSFTYDADNSAAADNGNYYYDWDYYCYSEPDYHWINFKRNSASHWHEDDEGATNIPYTNETSLGVGKGYFLSLKEESYLQAYGTLNDGSLASNANLYKVTVTDDISWTNRQGFNLVGNPYQSYLDFDQFAVANQALWDDDPTKAYYYIIDGNSYTKYVYSASTNPLTAPRLIHPHQGFFIVADNADADGTPLVFNDDMRDVTGTGVSFRDARQPSYPLVNLIATDDEGKRDIATVELNRPDKGGAKVMDNMRVGKGIVYCHYEDEDYAIAFTQPGISEVGIRFETAEDAPFTMTWDTENGEFHYLHLIDNMTGTDIDCLTAEEYKFTSKTTDYKSRFRLVFDYTGIDEPETDEPAEGLTAFAFLQMGNELVVNGEGYLEVIDVMGRIVRTEQLQGSQSTVPMPRCAAGVYVLRLTGRDGVRTQKMVVR